MEILWKWGYTVYCILYTVYCILYTVYCILHTVYCILCAVYCILYTCILYTVNCILCIDLLAESRCCSAYHSLIIKRNGPDGRSGIGIRSVREGAGSPAPFRMLRVPSGALSGGAGGGFEAVEATTATLRVD